MQYEKIDYDGFKIIKPKEIKLLYAHSPKNSPSHSKGISSGPDNNQSDS